MSCSSVNCSGGSDCKGEHGSFEESTGYGSIGDSGDCAPIIDWRIQHTVNPVNGPAEDYDENVDGKFMWLNSFFESGLYGTGGIPSNRITTECDSDTYGEELPSFLNSVEYYARHPSSENTSSYVLDYPFPAFGGDESSVVGAIIDIVESTIRSAHPLADAAGAVIQDFIGCWSCSSVETGWYDGSPDRQEIHWDLDWSDGDNWPTSPCSTSGVKFLMDPTTNTGDHSVNTAVRYSFDYYTHGFPENYCYCDESFHQRLAYTTDWVQNSASFEFK